MKKKAQSTKENQSVTPNKSFETRAKPASPVRAKNSEKGSPKATQKEAEQDINELILKDHRPLKSLIQTLKNPEIERSQKEDQFEEFVVQLMAHAKAEEQSLYLSMKEYDELKVESYEGDTEHAIAEQLIQEINACPDDNEWLAKVKVLAELVETHIREEEDQLLKKVEQEINEGARQMIGAEYTRIITEFRSLNFKMPPKRVNFTRDQSARMI